MLLHKIVPACLLIAILSVPAGGARADEATFRIQSFIPEYFTDLEWTITGKAHFHGRNSDQSGDLIRAGGELSDYDEDNQSLSVSSRLKYEWVTLPRFFTSSLAVSTGYGAKTSTSGQTENIDEYRYRDYTNKYDLKDYNFGIGQSLECGQYLYGDFFVSAEAAYSYRYEGYPKYETSAYNFYRYVHPGYIREDNSNIFQKFDDDSKTHQLSGQFNLGWGRMYEGRFAAFAIDMVDELRKSGLIKHEPTYDQMLTLTEMIYQYRRKHIIDSRLRRIEALEAVLSYLIEEGVIEDPGPYGCLLVQDVWDYFPEGDVSRSFGFTAEMGVGLGYSRLSEQHGRTDTQHEFIIRYYPDSLDVIDTLSMSDETIYSFTYIRQTEQRPFLEARLQYALPINKRWQFDAVCEGLYRFDDYRNVVRGEITENADYDDYYQVYGLAEARYFYDSRTTLDVRAKYGVQSWRAEYTRDNRLEPSEFSRRIDDVDKWTFSFVSSLQYRISIPTTLTVSFGYGANSIEQGGDLSDDVDNNSYDISAGLSHYLF